VNATEVKSPGGPAGRRGLLAFAAGLAVGAGACLALCTFPGGRGAERRVNLSFREGQEYRVRRVVDGDTIVIEPGVCVRYMGVNTPETREFVEVYRPFARESAEFNRRMVEGRSVRLRFGPQGLDRYGRLLACVEVRDPDSGRWVDVGEELARQGLARQLYRTEGCPNRDRISRAVEEARAAGRGVWSLRAGKRSR
jgi:micrococcal nuclease